MCDRPAVVPSHIKTLLMLRFPVVRVRVYIPIRHHGRVQCTHAREGREHQDKGGRTEEHGQHSSSISVRQSHKRLKRQQAPTELREHSKHSTGNNLQEGTKGFPPSRASTPRATRPRSRTPRPKARAPPTSTGSRHDAGAPQSENAQEAGKGVNTPPCCETETSSKQIESKKTTRR